MERLKMDDLPPRLRRLDRALIGHDGDGDPMLLSELDGFVAGILVCPDLILPGEWLPCVWGGGEEPVFSDMGDAQQIIGMLMEHYNAVSADLNRGSERYAPVFDIDTRHDETLWELWIEGFETAMALRPESWDAIAAEAGDPAEALLGMTTLIGIANDESHLPTETADALTASAPDLIPYGSRTCGPGG